ncbi:oligosaccharide flippase family protein [Lactococcus lactis subsp. lactis]|uniref:oligosaccharide flippase family protein n=1 Tax=Lactococcus lactis TaxID=1358 RepID=UPI00285F7824|nr:oligosaccharide flippase family protein [Lactococcus lactis]MDR7697566.1 oligosaccharide flippase family protein [Lactococcus lactis]
MKLIKNMGLSTIYQLLTVLIPLITAPYVSRILGSSGVGINAFTASILSYFVLIAGLGVQSYGNREIAYHQKNIKERTKIFWELQIIQVIASSISFVLFFIFLFFQDKYQFYFLLQSISLLAVVTNISWFFMGLENFRIIVFRNVIINIIVVALTFVLVKSSSDLWIYILLIVGSGLFANLSVWPFLRKEICRVSIKELNVKQHIAPATALLLPQIVTAAYTNINKSMLGWFDTTNSVAFFNQADMVIRAAFAAVSSFAGAFLPRLSNMFSEGRVDEGKKLILLALQIMYTLSFLAIAGIIGVSHNFAIFFFGNKFIDVGPLMAVEAPVILFFGIAVVIRSQYLMAVRRTKEITIASVIALGANIVVNLIMIPFLGAMGATITVLVTEAVTTGYLVWVVREEFRYREIFHGFWKYLISGIISCIMIWFINNFMRAAIFSYLVQTIIGCAVYIVILLILKAPIIKMLARLNVKKVFNKK